MARVARSSSTRAYAGHTAEFRHVFDIKKLNLTEYARSFGIYKIVQENMSKAKHAFKRKHGDKNSEKTEANMEIDEGKASELFTKRLQKSKLKDLERDLRDAKD